MLQYPDVKIEHEHEHEETISQQHLARGPGTGFAQKILTSDSDIVQDKIVNSLGSYAATAPLLCSGHGGS